jgi:hypothetical protein
MEVSMFQWKNVWKVMALFLFWGSIAEAHSDPQPMNLDEMIREADFIFQGPVMNVQYKMSTQRGVNTDVLPHTFVTYRIDRVFKGKAPAQTVTLRFLGGRGEQATFLDPENFPLFDLQDYDILFVKGNTVLGCPLVRCEAGRFRAIQDLMYSESGHEIILNRRQQVGTGTYHELEDILTHHVSQTVIRSVIVDEPGEGQELSPVVPGRHFHLQEFSEFLNGRIHQLYTPEQLDHFRPVVSANIQEPFVVKSPKQTRAPRKIVPPARPPADETAEDRRERSLLQQNGGNPVIH